MLSHDTAYYREPQSDSIRSLFESRKRIENSRPVRFRNARAVVVDADGNLFAFRMSTDGDAAFRKTCGVAQQISDGPVQGDRVGFDHGSVLARGQTIDGKLDVRMQRGVFFNDRGDVFGKRDRLAWLFGLAIFQPDVVEQFADKFIQFACRIVERLQPLFPLHIVFF